MPEARRGYLPETIDVFLLCVGGVRTPMLDRIIEKLEKLPAVVLIWRRRSPAVEDPKQDTLHACTTHSTRVTFPVQACPTTMTPFWWSSLSRLHSVSGQLTEWGQVRAKSQSRIEAAGGAQGLHRGRELRAHSDSLCVARRGHFRPAHQGLARVRRRHRQHQVVRR